MTPPLRRLGTLLTVGVAIVATAASSPADNSLFDSIGPLTEELTANEQTVERAVSAVLDAQAPLVAGSGNVELNVSFPPGAAGQVLVGLVSETSGEVNEVEVLDTEDQAEVSIGLTAFEDCEEAVECIEDLTVRFDRLEATVDSDLALEWRLEASVSLDLEADEPVDGSLTIKTD